MSLGWSNWQISRIESLISFPAASASRVALAARLSCQTSARAVVG